MIPPLTLLYVPGDREDRVRKALASDADVVLLDLEDAVAPAHKRAARDTVVRVLGERPARPVQVRVNGLGTPWAAADLAAVGGLDPAVGLRLPKVESVDAVAAALEGCGGGRAVHCLIESAVGVERAYDIARCDPAVASIGLGEADLRSELGIGDDEGLGWCRGRIVVAARAAGLSPPAQSVFPDVRDLAGLAASCRRGRSLGFLGRAAIHPRQLPVIREAYRPDEAEVARAREVVERVEQAREAGSAVVVLPDGSFLDAAMVAAAQRVLALAGNPSSG
ncbi:HpcH/HpaI aldolase/citrate lyase family protein [Pseudonocardia nigra]|uniref:HpcH/HpaI aldolase/citrate lyase family protein n=1 Tax=Pseudonocardia nigra TaxID=1921578 RepID=UPI001C5E6782|nr:CoA ester lyase [Pseudonocardia nigra]